MLDIAKIRSEVAKIKKMVAKFYVRLVVVEPIVEIVISAVHVPNIWEVLLDKPIKETKEK